MLGLLKHLLPNRSMVLPVFAGPFRGARIVANPRASLRKVFGLYEHELNTWLSAALPRVSRLIDVGANDGYFSIGVAAAMRRAGIRGEIICFEPQPQHLAELQRAVDRLAPGVKPPRIIPLPVGSRERDGMTTLDALDVGDRERTLIKIDVEGAELDVIDGARSWLRPSNLFVIEVHRREYVDRLRNQFGAIGLVLQQIDQQPLPVLGREHRDADNRWLVSALTMQP
jgi:hypothetical protein